MKPENLLRHLDGNHPNHPEAQAIRRRIREEARHAPRTRPPARLRIRKVHVAVVAGVVLIGAGLVLAAPLFDPYRNFSIHSCISEQTPYHIHVTLTIVTDGVQEIIPTNVGRTATCTKPLHTHDGEYVPQSQPARIHVESPVARAFTLRDFFTVWGRTFTPTQVVSCVGSVTMTVNGTPSTAYGDLVLVDGLDIVISCTSSG